MPSSLDMLLPLLLLTFALSSAAEEADSLNVSVYGTALLSVHCLESSTAKFQDVVNPVVPTNLFVHTWNKIFAADECWSALIGALSPDPHVITTCAGEVTQTIECPSDPGMVFTLYGHSYGVTLTGDQCVTVPKELGHAETLEDAVLVLPGQRTVAMVGTADAVLVGLANLGLDENDYTVVCAKDNVQEEEILEEIIVPPPTEEAPIAEPTSSPTLEPPATPTTPIDEEPLDKAVPVISSVTTATVEEEDDSWVGGTGFRVMMAFMLPLLALLIAFGVKYCFCSPPPVVVPKVIETEHPQPSDVESAQTSRDDDDTTACSLQELS